MTVNEKNIIKIKDLSSNALAGIVKGLLLQKCKMEKNQIKEEKTA